MMNKMENEKKISTNNINYIRLSYTLTENSPVHPALKRVSITPENQIRRGDAYNTSVICAENHSGTHVDAPAHFMKDGRPIHDYNPNELIFESVLIIDCPKNPDELIALEDISGVFDPQYLEANKDTDCILIRTGFGPYHEEDIETYLIRNPGISPEVVYYLRQNLPKLKCLGIDTVSMSRYGRVEEAIEVHQNAFKMDESLGKPLILVEDLNLRLLSEETELEEVLVIPWQVGEIDSAPCTVLARLNQFLNIF